MDQSYLANLTIFKSLFRGRDEIFAIRWEKGGKSNYFPAYDYDPYLIVLKSINLHTVWCFTLYNTSNLNGGHTIFYAN